MHTHTHTIVTTESDLWEDTQQSLLLCNLHLSISLDHMLICIPLHLLVMATSPILHRSQLKGGQGKYKRGEAKRKEEDDSFGVSLFPCLGSVGLIKDLSA